MSRDVLRDISRKSSTVQHIIPTTSFLSKANPPSKRGARVPFRVPPPRSCVAPVWKSGRDGAPPPGRVEPPRLVGAPPRPSVLHKGGHEGVRTPLTVHACTLPFHSTPRPFACVGGVGAPFARKWGQAARRGGGFLRGPPIRANGCSGADLHGLALAFRLRMGMSLFCAYREAAFPRAPPSARMGKGRAGGGAPTRAPFRAYRTARPRRKGPRALVRPPSARMGKGGTGSRVPSRAPFPRVRAAAEGGGGLGRASRALAYRAPRPMREGDWAGPRVPSRAPFPCVLGAAAEGGGPGRRALARSLSVPIGRRGWGKGAANDGDGMPSCAPPSARTCWRRRRREGSGGGGHRAPARKRGGGQGALPMRLPIRAQAEVRAQRGGSGPAWSPFASCLHVNEGRGGKQGVLTFPAPPLRVNGRRAARKRERGSPEREEGVNGGPPFPRPCLLCAKTGVGGQKAPSCSRANRGGGAKGAGGPSRSSFVYPVQREQGRTEEGGGKRGRPKGGG
ncbi:hypothetical protein EDB85DRAFT_1896005 [Lactarius pseudohatsudake]|nr:hypothetical protein EDB85DRAFT_1896005 [Lactarius pseudohatsudake]